MPLIKFETEEFVALPKSGTPDCYATSKELPKEQKAEAHIGFILDESSSMARVWQDTISGFNYYIAQLREEVPGAKMTFATFVADKVKVRGEDKSIDEILPLNTKTYTPYGSTPLVDSVMRIISLVEQRVLVEPKLKPIIVVQTDGQENSSKNYTMSYLCQVIKKKRAEGWRFILITCGYNPSNLCENMGIDPAAAVEYGRGKTKEAFKTISRLTTMSVKTGEEVVFSLEDKRRLK